VFKLPLFPLNAILFPGMPIYLHIFESRYKEMVRFCLENDQPFGVVLIRSGQEVQPGLVEPYPVGCTARIVHTEKLEDGRYNLTAVGEERFQIISLDSSKPYLQGMVETIIPPSPPLETLRRIRPLTGLVVNYLRVLDRISELHLNLKELQMPDDPLLLIYLAASLLQLPPYEKQALLESNDPQNLMQMTERLYKREMLVTAFMGKADAASARRAAWLN
jgi:uncharacterized protein